MRFTEKLVGMKVFGRKDDQVGTVADLVISKDKTSPKVTAVVVLFNEIGYIGRTPLLESARKIKLIVPWAEIKFEENKFILTQNEENLETKYLDRGEILVGKNIVDSIINTTRGVSIGRVNDVVIFEENGKLVIFGLSVGIIGIVAKLGLEIPMEIIDRGLGKSFAETVIAWKYVKDYRPNKGTIELNVGEQIESSDQIDWVESKYTHSPKNQTKRDPLVILPWNLVRDVFWKNRRKKK